MALPKLMVVPKKSRRVAFPRAFRHSRWGRYIYLLFSGPSGVRRDAVFTSLPCSSLGDFGGQLSREPLLTGVKIGLKHHEGAVGVDSIALRILMSPKTAFSVD